MSVIIRLQRLPLTASSGDIRSFFGGLRIPDGAVHIVGGPDGDAFIGFATDEDARQAMRKSGDCIHGNEVRLLLSSRSEMNEVIAAARTGQSAPPPAPHMAGPPTHPREESRPFPSMPSAQRRPDNDLPPRFIPPNRFEAFGNADSREPYSDARQPPRSFQDGVRPFENRRPSYGNERSGGDNGMLAWPPSSSPRAQHAVDSTKRNGDYHSHERGPPNPRAESPFSARDNIPPRFESQRGPREDQGRRTPTLPKEESWKDGRYDRSEPWSNAPRDTEPSRRPYDMKPGGTRPPFAASSNSREKDTPFGGAAPPRAPPSQPRIPTPPPKTASEEAFVELTRLPADLLRPCALEEFLAPATPLTLSSVKVVYGPGGLHVHSLVRFTSAMDAFNALKKDGDQGVRIRPSTKETFDSARDGLPPLTVSPLASLPSMGPPRPAPLMGPPIPLLPSADIGAIPPFQGPPSMPGPFAGGPPFNGGMPPMRPGMGPRPPIHDARGPGGRAYSPPRMERERRRSRSRSPRRDFKGDRDRARRERRRSRERDMSPLRGGSRKTRMGTDRYCIELTNAPFRARDFEIKSFFGKIHIISVKKVFNEIDDSSDRWVVEVTNEDDLQRALGMKGELNGRRINLNPIAVEEADRILLTRPGPRRERRTSPPPNRDSEMERMVALQQAAIDAAKQSEPPLLGAFSGPVYSSQRGRIAIRGAMRGGRGGAMMSPPEPSPPPSFFGRGGGRGGMDRGRGMRGGRMGGDRGAFAGPSNCLLVSNMPPSTTPQALLDVLSIPRERIILMDQINDDTAFIQLHTPQEALEVSVRNHPALQGGRRLKLVAVPKSSIDELMNGRFGVPRDADAARQLGPLGCVLSCAGFPPRVSLEEVLAFFAGFPVVEGSVRMRMDEGHPTGECMLAMEEEGAATAAQAALHGHSYRGAPIKVVAL